MSNQRLNRPEVVEVRSPTSKPLKVSFFGHFGSQNSGNESTLLAILSRLPACFPGSEFCCICTNPAAVAAGAGIEGVAITTRIGTGIRDHDLSFAERVPLAFAGLRAEFQQYVRAFRALKGSDVLIVPGTGLVTDV